VNSLDDIFDLQDQITESVVGAIGPKLERAEIERVRRKPTESLHAYDLFLRGMASLHLWTRESTDVALELFYKAMERDPDFVTADGLAAWCYVWRQLNGWTTDRSSLNLTGLVNVGAPFGLGPVAGLVGIDGGVVSGVMNLESSGVEAPDWRPRHDEHYHEA
jgi:hypothetical protein